MCRVNRWWFCGWLMLLQVLVAWAMPVVDTSEWLRRLFTPANLNEIEATYGADARIRAMQWQTLIRQGSDLPERDKLRQVNRFFNQMTFVSDQAHWGRRDYWATPVEFLGSSAGDCEDFSIAKYFTLVFLGVPPARLRLIYAKALTLNQAHMVLGYYESPSAVPLILDNINPNILSAAQRKDLAPVYSFNGDGLWRAKALGRGRKISSDIMEIDLVVDLLWRIERDQMQPTAAGR